MTYYSMYKANGRIDFQKQYLKIARHTIDARWHVCLCCSYVTILSTGPRWCQGCTCVQLKKQGICTLEVHDAQTRVVNPENCGRDLIFHSCDIRFPAGRFSQHRPSVQYDGRTGNGS
ncbi:hypothetical protein SCLCIDRAFT_245588 [Scleroderma citrinum Foug A]|uniref:Uncharacterized protein n=1 Tax=Scleroderma citrinum Foug A TaxID=1036808 RepID=A0A0C2ZV46_9AGAM|nr:hypothetical protein SCLCIDRAFT_245588 [Scleroderma citrinum Foug A]